MLRKHLWNALSWFGPILEKIDISTTVIRSHRNFMRSPRDFELEPVFPLQLDQPVILPTHQPIWRGLGEWDSSLRVQAPRDRCGGVVPNRPVALEKGRVLAGACASVCQNKPESDYTSPNSLLERIAAAINHYEYTDVLLMSLQPKGIMLPSIVSRLAGSKRARSRSRGRVYKRILEISEVGDPLKLESMPQRVPFSTSA